MNDYFKSHCEDHYNHSLTLVQLIPLIHVPNSLARASHIVRLPLSHYQYLAQIFYALANNE